MGNAECDGFEYGSYYKENAGVYGARDQKNAPSHDREGALLI